MKLINFKYQHDYIFTLTFANDECLEVDLKNLIQQYVNEKNVNTAQLDRDWGCLEFNNGMVDIDPKTLYEYAIKEQNQLVLAYC
jgi:hypothetical protein